MVLLFSFPVILIEEILKYLSKSIKQYSPIGDLSPVSRLAGSTYSKELDESLLNSFNPQQSTYQAPTFKEDNLKGFKINPLKVKDE